MAMQERASYDAVDFRPHRLSLIRFTITAWAGEAILGGMDEILKKSDESYEDERSMKTPSLKSENKITLQWQTVQPCNLTCLGFSPQTPPTSSDWSTLFRLPCIKPATSRLSLPRIFLTRAPSVKM